MFFTIFYFWLMGAFAAVFGLAFLGVLDLRLTTRQQVWLIGLAISLPPVILFTGPVMLADARRHRGERLASLLRR